MFKQELLRNSWRVNLVSVYAQRDFQYMVRCETQRTGMRGPCRILPYPRARTAFLDLGG